ncbi:hypothetical protein ACFWXO_13535 [Kitasatospora sp. NPDC059088]|uniref:hypothetical protein n=1 Tax=Kitasatospora sp. NPDC059088 TaxID=3346722 RepID=UPI0036C4F459
MTTTQPPASPLPTTRRRTRPTLHPALYLARTLDRHDRDRAIVAWSEPGTLLAIPTGQDWDTARMPVATGLAALARLQAEHRPDYLGPVLLDAATEVTYWLITRGTAPEHWSALGPGICLLPPGTTVDMPDPSPDRLPPLTTQPEPVRWLHWPVATSTLTPAVWLASTLTDLAAAPLAGTA